MRKTTALRKRISEVLEGAEESRRRRRRRRRRRSAGWAPPLLRSRRSVGDQFESDCLKSQNSISDLGSEVERHKLSSFTGWASMSET